MDVLTATTDVNDVISAIDECQLNMNIVGHEWQAYTSSQIMLDATGEL